MLRDETHKHLKNTVESILGGQHNELLVVEQLGEGGEEMVHTSVDNEVRGGDMVEKTFLLIGLPVLFTQSGFNGGKNFE